MISAVLDVIADIIIDGLDKGVPGAEKEDFANHGERIWGRGVRYLLQCFCSRRATTKTVAFGVFLIVAQSAKA